MALGAAAVVHSIRDHSVKETFITNELLPLQISLITETTRNRTKYETLLMLYAQIPPFLTFQLHAAYLAFQAFFRGDGSANVPFACSLVV